MFTPRGRIHLVAVSLIIVGMASGLTASAAAASAPTSASLTVTSSRSADAAFTDGWVWPATGFRLARPYVAPAHRYGPGHRGIDLQLFEDLSVYAPAAGVVAFAGPVAGREVVTVDHGSGLVTSFEPVTAIVRIGDAVEAGERIGVLSSGGHAGDGMVHVGLRLDGEYLNPLVMLGGVPGSVLLPCCE
ncbi:hypothetical protein GCM10009808_05850 [Microbacterium sediminicola]|uniref:M23ase beta-sheet core domain-containing protein n=1 Tax=Microbacterium sediminicola TaxID=415210 RepID=A0ABP4TQQ8_9MICO